MPDPSPKPAAIPPSLVSTGGKRQFPCAQCGAKLEFTPGTTSLTCPYCSHVNPIQLDAAPEELDYQRQLALLESGSLTHETMRAKCDGCAAEVDAPPNVTAFACPYCGNNIVATAQSHKEIKPNAVLPFKVKQAEARGLFRKWISSRWFAPSELKRRAGIDEGIVGVYLPAWTYDCDTESRYTGARGDYYYVTETYSAMENGRSVTRTRQVRHTRWSGAAGTVENIFDDLLVLASQSLPAKLVQSLEPWDLKQVVNYSDEYLSGFRAESYQLDLPTGFGVAKTIMDPVIRSTIRSDIGGDEQRIDTMNVRYDDITFKHLLLPVWVSAYRFKNKVYRFLVNARTGEVQGDRPYSPWKIAALVIAILLVIAVIALLVSSKR